MSTTVSTSPTVGTDVTHGRAVRTTTLARAAVRPAPATLARRTIPSVALRHDQALVRVLATGVCHAGGGVDVPGAPASQAVVGHERAGVVEQVGPGVSGVRRGDRVLVGFPSCGRCAACLQDHPAYCETSPALDVLSGTRLDGTRTLRSDGGASVLDAVERQAVVEPVVVDAHRLVVLPPDADLTTAAALACGVLTGFGSVWDVLDPRPGARLAVLGTGAIGLAAVAAAAARSPELLVAVDLVPERLELALELGATHALHARADDVPERLVEITRRRGLTGALDTTGDPHATRTALDALGLRGELAVCGVAPRGAEFPVDLRAMLAGRSVRGVTLGDADPRRLLPRVLAMVADGTFPLDRLVRRYRLDEIDAAVDDLHHARVVKPVLVP